MKTLRRLTIMFTLFLAVFAVSGTSVKAANKLKTVTPAKVTTKTTKLKLTMKSKKKYRIVIKAKSGSTEKTLVEMYTKKSKKHTVYIPKQKKGTVLTIKLYWKSTYQKSNKKSEKKITVQGVSTTPATNSKTAEAIIAEAMKTIAAGKTHKGSDSAVKAGTDYYYGGTYGSLAYGDYEKYIEEDVPALDAYGLRAYSGLKAKNGATLYVTAFWGGSVKERYENYKKALSNGVDIGTTAKELEEWYADVKQYNFSSFSQISEPTTTKYDFKITSGNEVKWYAKNYPYLWNTVGNVYYKVYAYVNGKLVAVNYDWFPLSGVKGTYYEGNY